MARILVIEDDIMNAKLFSLILMRRGHYEVIIAKNADDAVERGTSDEIDLIIMDVSLQNWAYEGRELNGIGLTRIIKKRRATFVPVLLATAHAMRNDEETLLRESGADGYFSKPIADHNLFLSKVQGLLSLAGKTRIKGSIT